MTSNIFLTSDQHYNHTRILTYCAQTRPYSSVEEMNEDIIKNHNTLVKDNDTVYHLGDFCLGEKYVKEHLARLNGKHILIAGNHDACFFGKKGWESARKKYYSYGFESVYDGYLFPYKDNFIHFHHFPYAAEKSPEFESKYNGYRPKRTNDVVLLCHGHTHQENIITGPGMINIGIDAWKRPASIEEIYNYIK